MTAQLPAAIVVASAQIASPLSAALEKTGKFAGVYSATSAVELMELGAELPESRYVYLLSPTVDLNIDGVGLKDIGDELSDHQHAVMVIGGDSAGESFAQSTGFPVLKPRTNLVQAIAPVCGVDLTPPAPRPETSKPPVVADEVRRAAVWREAREEKETRGSRELAPRADSGLVWQNAVDTSRRMGTLKPGHRRRGWIISFAVRKGGVGKTSLTVNSAAYMGRKLADAGRRVVVVDMNLQQSDIGNYIHKQTPNVFDIVRNPNLLTSEHIEDALVYSEKHNFWALLGPSHMKDANPHTLNADLYKQILDLLRTKFDYILVDTPVGEFYHAILNMVLPESSYVIVPVHPARVTLHDVSEWLSHVTAPRHTNGYGINQQKMGLVLNRAKYGIGLDPADVEDRLSEWDFIGLIPDSDEWQLAENTGGLVGSNPPDDIAEVLRHMLYKATNDPALKPTSGGKGGARPSKSSQGKFGWLKRLLS